jgi:hypothetical protein
LPRELRLLASGRARDFSRSLTPCTFRLGGPPDPQHSLTSPVARTADDELPPSPSGPAAPPKSHRRAAALARTAPPACPLRLTRLTTRNAFDWLHPTSRPEGVARSLNSRWATKQPEHPFTICSDPPVTVMGRHISLSLVVSAMLNKRHRPSRARHLSPISAIDLLSTCTRQVLQFPSSPALTVPTAVSDLAPLTRTLVRTLEHCRHRRRRIAASGISDPK